MKRVLALALLVCAAVQQTAYAAKQLPRPKAAVAVTLVNSNVVDLIREYDPNLSVTAAKCPAALPKHGGAFACSITVNGGKIVIPLSYDLKTQRVLLPAMSFYETAKLTAMSSAQLAGMDGIHATVDCGNSAILAFRAGTIFYCSVGGVTTLHRLKYRAMANGQLFTYRPDGVRAPQWILDALASHDANKPTIVQGANVQQWMDALERSAAAIPTEFTVECPATLDLSGDNRAICSIDYAGGQKQRFAVFVKPLAGVTTEPIDAALDMEKVRRTVESANFVPLCPDAVRVVQSPPGDTTCDAIRGGSHYTLQIHVVDARGTLTWRAIPVPAATPAAASPAPTPTSTP